MNGFELNKILGAATSALLAFLLLGFFSEKVFHSEPPEEPAYAVAIAEGEDEGGEEEAGPDMAALLAAADPADGEKVFKKCAACHKLEKGANAVGPYLYGVVGRAVDTAEGFNYSGALEKVADVWGFEHLFGFLENPKGYAPGTSMGFAGLRKPEDRAAVIAYLNQQSDAPLPLPEPSAPEEAAAEEAPAEEAAAEETPTEEAAPAEEASASDAQTEETAAAPTEEASAQEVAAAPAEEASAADAQTEATAPAAAGGAAPEGFAALYAAATVEQGEKVFKKCRACHGFDEGKHRVGPSLHGVVGAPIAHAEGFKYSSAMAEHGGEWDYAALDAWLEKPRDFISGNKMSFAGLRKPEDRAAVIKYMNEASGSNYPAP